MALTYEEEELLRQRGQPASMLPRTRRMSAGGTVTNNVQPGDELGTGREVLTRALQMLRGQPDVTALNELGQQRMREGDSSMLNALAAQFAGPDFEPVQGQYLRRALAAQDPMKIGNYGVVTGGRFVADPYASRDAEGAALLNIGGQLIRDENQAARENRLLQAQERALEALTFGAGDASQIGVTNTNSPVFRSRKGGYLFTYNDTGAPTPYQGPVLPKPTNAAPTEDERKAAGWFAQADSARRNIARVITQDPNASIATFKEGAMRAVPFVGEAWANTAMSDTRQQFIQAASSMAEAFLRAATGAGVTESEAKQKVNELIPVVGDKPGVISQKLKNYDVYMAALRARAGKALPQLEPQLEQIYQQPYPSEVSEGVVDLPPRPRMR